LAEQLADPSSQFFQRFRSLIGQQFGQIGTNALLAPLQAGGSNFAQSQFIAGQQRKAFGRQRQDRINQATQQFGLAALGQVGNLLGVSNRANLGVGNLALGQEELRLQEQQQQASFFDFLAPFLGGTAGFLVGGPLGAGIGSSVAGLFGGSTASPAQPRRP